MVVEEEVEEEVNTEEEERRGEEALRLRLKASSGALANGV